MGNEAQRPSRPEAQKWSVSSPAATKKIPPRSFPPPATLDALPLQGTTTFPVRDQPPPWQPCAAAYRQCVSRGDISKPAPQGGIAPVEAYMNGLRMHAGSRMSCPLRMVEPDPLGSRVYPPPILLTSVGIDCQKTRQRINNVLKPSLCPLGAPGKGRTGALRSLRREAGLVLGP